MERSETSSFLHRSQDSEVGVATRLLAGRSGVRISAGATDFFLLHVQTGSWAHLAYSVATGGSFPQVQRPEHEVNHSLPTSAVLKNEWSSTSALVLWTGNTSPLLSAVFYVHSLQACFTECMMMGWTIKKNENLPDGITARPRKRPFQDLLQTAFLQNKRGW